MSNGNLLHVYASCMNFSQFCHKQRCLRKGEEQNLFTCSCSKNTLPTNVPDNTQEAKYWCLRLEKFIHELGKKYSLKVSLKNRFQHLLPYGDGWVLMPLAPRPWYIGSTQELHRHGFHAWSRKSDSNLTRKCHPWLSEINAPVGYKDTPTNSHSWLVNIHLRSGWVIRSVQVGSPLTITNSVNQSAATIQRHVQ